MTQLKGKESNVFEVFQGLEAVESTIGHFGFDQALHHLIKLRVSQINQCGSCVKMHT